MICVMGTSLRGRLLLLTTVAILPIIGLVVFMAVAPRRPQPLEAQEHALHLVRVIAQRHEQLIEETRHLLASLAQAPEVSARDAVACQTLVTTHVQHSPAYGNLGVLHPDGTLFCSAIPVREPDPVSERVAWRRVLEMRAFAMGAGQRAPGTVHPSVAFGYPVYRATGDLQLVLFATLDPAWLPQVTTAVSFPTHASLAVLDTEGTVLARYPAAQHQHGPVAPDTSLASRLLAQGEAGTMTITARDGRPWVYAFTRLHGVPPGAQAFVSLESPVAALVAQVPPRFPLPLVWLGCMVVLAGTGTWVVGDRLILRWVRALVRATQRLVGDDLSARTGVPYHLGELGHLARACDTLATTLAMQQTAARQAEAVRAQQAERLQILHDIDRALLAEDTPEAIAGAAIQPVRALLGVPRAIVNLFDLAANEVEWLAAAGRHRVHVGPGIRYAMQFMGDVAALRRGEVQIIDTHALPPGPEVEALLASGVELYMVVPMIAGRELIGALSFGGAPGPFPADQVRIAQETAAQLAIVLAQARLHERLKRQAERMRLFNTVVESSADAILTETMAGIITGWNPAAERLYGFTASEAMGQSSACLVPADRQDEWQTMLAQMQCGERLASYETIRLHQDGTRLDVSLTMSPVTTPEGLVLGVSTMARDMTVQKQLQEQLRQAQKMEAIGQLTGGLAHDFNNMLGVIVGNLDLMELQAGEEPGLLRRIQTAQRAALRAADLTRRLLAFARRQPLHPVPTAVNDLITELCEMLPRTLGPEIQIVTHLTADLPLVQIDPPGLENALLNLAINARDAMPQGGTLTVATECVALDTTYAPVQAGAISAGLYIWIAVSDTGHGMTREVLERVFDPFFTTKPRDKGTGMGLAMVYGFIKQSHGNIRVYSEPGHGTTVHLYLPLIDQTTAVTPETHATAMLQDIASGQGLALVVDDEVELLEIAVAYLEEMGFTTLQATDGPTALAVAARTPALDLLLTDVVMPGGMHGVALAQQLRRQHPAMQVIYASGFPSNALVERNQLHIDGPLINKPYRREQLTAIVQQVFARHHDPTAAPDHT